MYDVLVDIPLLNVHLLKLAHANFGNSGQHEPGKVCQQFAS